MPPPKATIGASSGRSGTEIQVVRRPIASLHLDPKNPRRHTRKQIHQIAESIKAYGFNAPVLVDKEGKVIAGHGRLLACQELGWVEVPTIALEHLSEAQAKAYALADNRLTEISTWDDQLLAEQLRDLSLADLDFNLEATGFDMGEIDLLIEGLESKTPDEDPADEVPPLAEEALSRVGDLWALGPHRVLCGNALEAESYRLLLGEDRAAVVFTDSPYNVPIKGHVGGNGAVHHREFPMASGEMSAAEFTAFLTTVCQNLIHHSADGSLHYLCMDWRGLRALLAAGSAYTELKNLCVWAKDTAGMGSLYRSQHELILVFKKGTAPHQNHVQLGRFGRSRSNVWKYPGANSFGGRTTEEGNLLALHPTVKPVALVADALKDASSRGDLVLDPFLGSGTTLLAAERTGRVCRSMELDPLYVDTAIRRWQALTGRKALQVGSGRTFDELQAESKAQCPAPVEPGPPPEASERPPVGSAPLEGEAFDVRGGA